MKKKESFWTAALVLAVLIGLIITTGGCPPRPDGGEGEGEGEIQIPNLTGQLQADAQAAIVAAGLVVGDVTEMCSDTMSAGRVISNDPVGGTSVNSGANVDLLVSTGPCPGEGEGEGEIEINTIEELQLIGNDSAYPLDGNYVLAQDIDASATAGWNDGAGFKPIGQFSGVFNGQGYIIANLTINRPTKNGVGLFASVSADGEVMNVGLEGGAVMGLEWVGGLVGYNEGGVVTNCYTTGTITGFHVIGGLIGNNYGGMVTNCYATGVVVGENYIMDTFVAEDFILGGLIGYNSGQLTDCYATGAVTGYKYVGGLVGGNYCEGGVVTNCYATGAVVGNWFVGGLVGDNISYFGLDDGITITSFWNTQTSGQTTSAGGGTGLTTAEMIQQATFAGASWDFGSVWTIEEGCTYPYLQQLVSPFTGCVY